MGFNDAIKLFSKELVIPNQSNKFQFFLSPILGLIIVLIIFFSFPFFEINFSIRISIIFIYIIIKINIYFFKFLIFIPIIGVWLISCVAETNRTPFDFAEGESELVSGFNIEYGSVKFAIIFIAEYGMIFILSLLTRYLFFFPNFQNHFIGRGFGIFLVFVIIWLRATLPRFRYDLLILVT